MKLTDDKDKRSPSQRFTKHTQEQVLLLVSHLCYKINRFLLCKQYSETSYFITLDTYCSPCICITTLYQQQASTCADLRVLSSINLYQKSSSFNALVQSFSRSYVNWVRRCWGHKKWNQRVTRTHDLLHKFSHNKLKKFCFVACLSPFSK